MAVGSYGRAVTRAREAVLAHNLQIIRQAIDNYTLDKQVSPQSLDELVQAGYLKAIPADPLLREKDWQIQLGHPLYPAEQTSVGIEDVHSNSVLTALDGTVYSSW
jgi:general secretion pathway protein G